MNEAIVFFSKVVNRTADQKPHYAIALDRGAPYALLVVEYFRFDIWNKSALGRIVSTLNRLEFKPDTADSLLAAAVKQAIRDELQYQCDREDRNRRHTDDN